MCDDCGRYSDAECLMRQQEKAPHDHTYTLISDLNAWLDSTNDQNPDITFAEDTAMRVLKVTEEAGEAAAAYIGWTGQNPRKGVTHDLSDVIAELCDVALTALCAVEHLVAGGRKTTEELFREHVAGVHERAGL